MVWIQKNEIDLYWGVGRWRVTGQQTTYFCSCVLLRIVQIYLCVCVSHFLSHPHGSRPNCPHRNCPRPNLPGTIRRDQGYIKQVFLKRRDTVKVKMHPNSEVLQMSQPQIAVLCLTIYIRTADSNHGIGGQNPLYIYSSEEDTE